MNASWMFGSTIATLCFACAAMLLEPVAALYRRIALRWVWIAAFAASLGFMAFGLFARRPSIVVSEIPFGSLGGEEPSAPATAARPASQLAAPPAVVRATKRATIDLPTVPPSVERAVFIVWGAASAVLALSLLVAALRLRGERNEWKWGRLNGRRVLLSPNFGPAIVGVLDPEIVVPRWVAELDEPARRAIVAHEAEHVRAHDPVLLLAGLVVVVLIPWNLGLWLCWRGLRRTIELDCDARVLAAGMPRTEYANVLLGAWQRTRSSWLPSPAFAERASGLGRRVEHLLRREPRRRVMRTIAGLAGATVCVLIASVTPARGQRAGASQGPGAPYPLVIIDGVKRPDLPPRYRYTGAVVAETTTTPSFKITYKGPIVLDTVADKLYPSRESLSLMQTIPAPASVAHFGPAAAFGADLYYTRKYRDAGGPILFPREGSQGAPMKDPGTPPGVMAQRAYDRMFAGIALTAAHRATALDVIGKYDAAIDALPRGPMLAVWPRVVALTDERDVALRALVTGHDDLAKFDVHATEGKPHGDVSPDAMADKVYVDLFVLDTIAMTQDAKGRAREIIRRALIEERNLYDRAPSDFDGRVVIRRRRDADLRALLTSDRDRAKFDVRAERAMKWDLVPPPKPKTL